jgi:hypothetical protein
VTPENWSDLYDRIKRAERQLEELADETNDASEASRLMSKAAGVALARDYMRGYFDPTSVEAAKSHSTTSRDRPLAVWKFAVNPFGRTQIVSGAIILHVGAQGDEVCVWALVNPSFPMTEVNIAAYGTGHPVPADPGRFLGTAQMDDGLVFHLFDGDDQGNG